VAELVDLAAYQAGLQRILRRRVPPATAPEKAAVEAG
jgi:hypothetical protein